MSADENNASAMCSAGLVDVSCAVLCHCADAEEEAASAAGEARDGAPFPAEEISAGGSPEEAPRLPPGEGGAERLREVACGLLANVCSHRSLR